MAPAGRLGSRAAAELLRTVELSITEARRVVTWPVPGALTETDRHRHHAHDGGRTIPGERTAGAASSAAALPAPSTREQSTQRGDHTHRHRRRHRAAQAHRKTQSRHLARSHFRRTIGQPQGSRRRCRQRQQPAADQNSFLVMAFSIRLVPIVYATWFVADVNTDEPKISFAAAGGRPLSDSNQSRPDRKLQTEQWAG